MKGKHYSDRAAVAANQNVKEKKFWLEELSGELVKSRFPYDNNGFQMNEGENRKLEKETYRFPENLSSKSIKLSNDVDLKLHMILVAGLTALLEKYTGKGDIVIGSPILKQDMEAEFINTILVFRIRLENSMTFKESLIQVKETIVTATKNQNFPMEVLPDLLHMPVFGSEFPLFDVVLMLENIHDKSYLEGIHYNMLFSFNRLEGGIEGSLEYNSLLYGESTIKQIVNHYTRLMEKGLSDLNVRLVDIDILSEQERHCLLKEYNAMETDFPEDKTFHRLFEEQAERRADSIAAVAHSEIHMTYRTYMTYKELNEKSNRVARLLREKGVKPDTVVAIMVGRSIEMIIGVIGIIKAGGAYLPIDPDYPEERKQYMLADSNARILITARNLSEGIVFEKEIIYLENYKKPAANLESFFHAPCAMPQASVSLAYVIYTSGSTGKPKGVMVQHNHFVNVGMGWRKEYRLQEIEVNLLQMASFSFDVFAGDLARTFLNGGKMVISSESAVDPESLYQLITSHRVTLFESTPSYIIPFMNYVYKNNLAIDSLQLLILGSDVCPSRDFKELVARFGKQMRIINSYGVTEATIDSSYYEPPAKEELPSAGSVPIGKPLPNVKYYILDMAGSPLPIGVPGELYIGGESVTRGYLNNPVSTSEKFNQDLQDYQDEKIKQKFFGGSRGGTRRIFQKSPPGGRRLYKTGDLARWLPDGSGNVEFLGRMDYQVKVRGYRIELGEIESKLLEHEDIKEAVVVEKIEENDNKYLCAYIISDKPLEASDLREFLGQKLPDYMVPWFFVQMEKFPLTPNGKIDRKVLPEPETIREIEYVAPRDEMERQLVEMWAEVLFVDKEGVGIDTRFFDLGGNSLKGIVLISNIHKILNVKVSLADIFNLQTIRELAKHIKGANADIYLSIEKTEHKPYYAMSSAQKRLFVLHQLEKESTGYNIPLTVVVEGKTGKEKLEEVFKSLIARHESLRTSFVLIDEEPVQKIHKKVEFRIDFYDLKRTQVEAEVEEGIPHSPQDFIKRFVRPFDLSQAPLFRVGLIKLEEDKHILIVDMHHIVSDGISHNILVRDFTAFYTGNHLPLLKLQYKDYSEWQNSQKEIERRKKQQRYWLNRFSGSLPILKIPIDYPRPAIQSFEGSTFHFRIEKEQTAGLKKRVQQEGVTLQMLMAAIFHILLSKLSGLEDIITGTSIAGRSHADLEGIIGIFVNTLALRNFPSPGKTFGDFLKEVKENSLRAYENQDYPFEDLVKKVVVNRDNSRNPIFDILFEIQAVDRDLKTGDVPEIEIPGLRIRPYKSEIDTTKFDMDWVGVDRGDEISFTVMYCSKLFKEDSVRLMSDRYVTLIDSVLDNTPQSELKELEYSTDIEKKLSQVQEVTFDF